MKTEGQPVKDQRGVYTSNDIISDVQKKLHAHIDSFPKKKKKYSLCV